MCNADVIQEMVYPWITDDCYTKMHDNYQNYVVLKMRRMIILVKGRKCLWSYRSTT